MSIINDALKKVQQGLTQNTKETQENPSQPKQSTSAYIYEETPSAVENLPPTDQKTVEPKPPAKNKFKAILALACAAVIIAGSALYILQQFKTDIPKVKTFARKSFDKLIHKEELPEFKTKTPEELKSLAQLTINPSTAKTPNAAKPAPVTLNIHGIMSNSSGNLVLINDQVYQEGDVVDGAKIVKIDLDSIKVINNGIEQTILVKS